MHNWYKILHSSLKVKNYGNARSIRNKNSNRVIYIKLYINKYLTRVILSKSSLIVNYIFLSFWISSYGLW